MEKIFDIKIFLILSAFVLLINVGSFGVIETSDARYAEIAREMYVSQDYLHPNLLDIHHYHKPPITYQITALGYKIFGINPFGARFFLQIAILIQILIIYKISLLLFDNKKTALLSSICYFSMPIVLISSRNLTTDGFLTTFAIASIYFWIKYRKEGSFLNLYLFYLSLAFGFLTKGPVIFIMPFVFVLFFNFIEKPKQKLSIHHLFAFILFIIVGLSWYLYLTYYNSDFFYYFIGKQTVERFSKNVFNRTEPFWYFIVIAPILGLPWLPFIPFLIKKFQKIIKFKSIYFVLIISFLLPLIFFSISSSKRPLYILPLYGVMSILIVQLIGKLNADSIKFIKKLLFGYSLIIPVAFIIAPFVQKEYQISKIIILVAIFIIILLGYIFKNNKLDLLIKPFLLVFISSAFFLVASSNVLSLNELKLVCPRPVTDFIKKNNLRDREILIYNRRLPSIAFGLNKSIIALNYGNSGLKRETQFETNDNWKNYLINMHDEKEVQKLKKLMKNKKTLLITYKNIPHNDRKWLLDYYKNEKVIGKWHVFY